MLVSRGESSCVCTIHRQRIHRQSAGKQCSDPLAGSACTAAVGGGTGSRGTDRDGSVRVRAIEDERC